MLRPLPGLLIVAALAAAVAAARAAPPDLQTLALARQEAQTSALRARRFEDEAREATDAAVRARAAGEALAARIEAAEADLTAAEARVAIVERLRAEQRARLAERQAPVVRLTAALQSMARRPPALALIQPGSVDDLVHVRTLLAATLPEIRRRTAALRAEVRRGEALQRRAERARNALAASRTALRERREALARFEAEHQTRSRDLAGLALAESDKALAFGEEARALARLIDTREYQARLEADLAALPGPEPRPGTRQARASRRGGAGFLLPVEGRVITGTGEISEAGVHARGVTLATAPGARVLAPAGGQVLYAAPFRSYGRIAILDHGNGWSSVITGLDALAVEAGERVRRGAVIGNAARRDPRVTVELRHGGRPVPIAELLAG